MGEPSAEDAVATATELAQAEQAARLKAEGEAKAATQKLAAMEQQLRTTELKAVATAGGFPEGLLQVYPADKPATAEAMAEFAASIGVKVEPPATDWANYTPPAGAATGADQENPINERVRKLQTEQQAIMRRLRDNPYQVTREEELRQDEINQEINEINQEWERLIMAGQADVGTLASGTGMGGRINPPAWANRTLDPRAGQSF